MWNRLFDWVLDSFVITEERQLTIVRPAGLKVAIVVILILVSIEIVTKMKVVQIHVLYQPVL